MSVNSTRLLLMLGLALATAQTWAQDSTSYVTAAAHVSGIGGTQWRTDLEVHNRGQETTTVEISLQEHGVDNSEPRTTSVSVDPATSLRIEDALETLFAFEGAAAIRLNGGGADIIVTSRTYNLGPDGTFGQFIPSTSVDEASAEGMGSRLIQLTHSTDTEAGFRTNIGLVNTNAAEITVDVSLFAADGTLLGTVSENLPPFGYRQLNRVFERVTSAPVADGYAVVTSADPGARLLPYASVVDNVTGDPIYIPPVRSVSGEALVAASASAEGVGGTRWLTDLEVHNPGQGPASFAIDLLASGQANPNPPSVSYPISAGVATRLRDVLDGEFSYQGTGSLRVSPTGGSIMLSSRTFNTGGGGTYGQYIPAVDELASATPAGEVRLIQLSHSSDPETGFRTNIGFLNTSDATVTIELGLYQADAVELGRLDVVLLPFEHRQLNGVFAQVTDADVPDGYAVIATTTPTGRFIAYASVIDNRTGDPIYIAAE